MGTSESIYRARGVESGATESEGQPMHRTLLGSALVAIWQYLILAGGPQPCDPDPLGLESKSCEQKLQQIGAYLQEIGVLSAATNTAL